MDKVSEEVKIDTGVLGETSCVLVGAEEDMRDIANLCQLAQHTVLIIEIQCDVLYLHSSVYSCLGELYACV